MINTTTYIQICTSVEDIRAMTNKEAELPMLKQFIIRGWLHSKDKVEPGIKRYWLIRHEVMMIDGVVMKGK